MTRDEITNQSSKYLDQAMALDSDIESNKLEFKRQWFDLKAEGVFTCARHISGIANSLGAGGGFLIFGFDAKEKTFHPAKLSDSGYSDTSEIYGVVNKKLSNDVSFEIVDFEYEGKPVSVVHILPSISKPHILPHYKNPKNGNEQRHVTFIRNGTKTDLATKEDFDRMYADRTNIFVDHKLEVVLNRGPMMSIALPPSGKLTVRMPVIFENLGTRPIVIRAMDFDVESIPVFGVVRVWCALDAQVYHYKKSGLLLETGQLVDLNLVFDSDRLETYSSQEREITDYLKSTARRDFVLSNFLVRNVGGKEVFPEIVLA